MWSRFEWMTAVRQCMSLILWDARLASAYQRRLSAVHYMICNWTWNWQCSQFGSRSLQVATRALVVYKFCCCSGQQLASHSPSNVSSPTQLTFSNPCQLFKRMSQQQQQILWTKASLNSRHEAQQSHGCCCCLLRRATTTFKFQLLQAN